MTMKPDSFSFIYYVWVNGSVSVRLLMVQPKAHRVEVINSSHTGYITRIRYTEEDSPSQIGQLRFTIYNVTVQDAGTYYCQGTNGQEVTGCRQVLVVVQRPTTPTITGPASPVSGENVTLTCSSTSRSLPQDHPLLTMTYIWRRDRTLLESGDESPTGGDDLTIIHASRENWGDIYSCQAVEEGLKSDWSQEHVLDVLYGPDQIHFDGIRGKLEEGKPVTTRCSADCNPACTVTWWDTSRQMVMTGHRKAVLSIPAVDVSVSRQYMCHVNNTHGSASRNLTLDVFSREVTESGVVSTVPVTAVCSVLIVVIAVVVIVVVCRKHRRGGKGYTFNRVVTYTRDADTDGGYEEIAERGCARHRLVSYHRENENDGSYQEIEGDANVDDIVPIVVVYSVMLTAVAVVVAAVTVLVCKDIKENQDNRGPQYQVKPNLTEQFHIYTSLHSSTSSTEPIQFNTSASSSFQLEKQEYSTYYTPNKRKCFHGCLFYRGTLKEDCTD
ncbi:carcinoembryonic antigen-related cell adhesion molecule 6-like [Haliotis asinina]|uniref:carcinoembryonic antigen-related cell adhesion molecule 6-like n=1 Tax=Haliotis asinina TaxID=109174 RepID=UPI003531D8D3